MSRPNHVPNTEWTKKQLLQWHDLFSFLLITLWRGFDSSKSKGDWYKYADKRRIRTTSLIMSDAYWNAITYDETSCPTRAFFCFWGWWRSKSLSKHSFIVWLADAIELVRKKAAVRLCIWLTADNRSARMPSKPEGAIMIFLGRGSGRAIRNYSLVTV